MFALGGVLLYLIVATGPHTGANTSSNGGMSMDMAAGNAADHGSAQYPYAVGDPGVGVAAPEFKLRSTAGGTFDLSSYLGKQYVLLYFQEGLMCQPCWDQVVAIQKQLPAFHTMGINTIVTITSNPYDQLKQKAAQAEGHRRRFLYSDPRRR